MNVLYPYRTACLNILHLNDYTVFEINVVCLFSYTAVNCIFLCIESGGQVSCNFNSFSDSTWKISHNLFGFLCPNASTLINCLPEKFISICSCTKKIQRFPFHHAHKTWSIMPISLPVWKYLVSKISDDILSDVSISNFFKC